MEEGVHLGPGRGTGKNDPIVDVHAQSGLWGCVDMGEEGGGVERPKDGGEGGALRGANWLIAKGTHLTIEGQVDMMIGEEGQGPIAHARRETKVDEDGCEAVLVHVVEEALNVKHEGSTAASHCGVRHGHCEGG